MRMLSRLLGTTLFVLFATGPSFSVPAMAQADKVSVGYSNIAGAQIMLWTAADNGYFTNHGVNADVQLIAGGANTVAALVAGQVQIADAGGSEALSAVANGADLVVIGTVSPVYAYVLEVTPDIQSPADLVGKKLGVATFGGSADIATRVVLRQYGIDPESDVTLIATGSAANRTAALLSGAIQGGMAGGPPDTLSLEAQGLHPLFDLAALKLPAAIDAIIAQRAWVNANHDLVQRYVDSLVEANAHARQDREGTIALLKKYYKSDDDVAMAATYDFTVKEVLPALPYPKAEQFSDAVQQLSVDNPKVADIDLSKLLDPSFIQSAADRGLAG
jgi:NitT/TauT family transport system substrate-binding protein